MGDPGQYVNAHKQRLWRRCLNSYSFLKTHTQMPPPLGGLPWLLSAETPHAISSSGHALTQLVQLLALIQRRTV